MPKDSPLIGILALQGNFQEHAAKFRGLGCEVREIRRTHHLDEIDALVLPGGESTAIAILEEAEAGFSAEQTRSGVFDKIQEKAHSGLPIWGTCMGSILLAKEIEGSSQGRLALMDIAVRRNAFGPQRFSSELEVDIPALGDDPFHAVFIRAPLITKVSADAESLATVPEGVIMARQGKLLATVFHPEVTDDFRVHAYFLSMI